VRRYNPKTWKLRSGLSWNLDARRLTGSLDLFPRIRFKSEVWESLGSYSACMSPAAYTRHFTLKFGWLFFTCHVSLESPQRAYGKKTFARYIAECERQMGPFESMSDYFKRYYGTDIPDSAFTMEYRTTKLKQINERWLSDRTADLSKL